MKKSLTFFALLILSISAFAQLKIGIKGGANYAYINSEGTLPVPDWDALTSYHVGGFAQLHLNDKVAVRGELVYSFEGAEFEDAIVGNEKLNIDYLNMPIMIRFHLISALYLDLGVEPGVIVNKSNDLIIDKNAEVGALVGVGFRLGERFGLFARYVHGLTDLYEQTFTDVNGQSIGNGSGRARLWQIGGEIYLFK